MVSGHWGKQGDVCSLKHSNKHTNKGVITIAVCSRKGLTVDRLAKAHKLRLQKAADTHINRFLVKHSLSSEENPIDQIFVLLITVLIQVPS